MSERQKIAKQIFEKKLEKKRRIAKNLTRFHVQIFFHACLTANDNKLMSCIHL